MKDNTLPEEPLAYQLRTEPFGCPISVFEYNQLAKTVQDAYIPFYALKPVEQKEESDAPAYEDGFRDGKASIVQSTTPQEVVDKMAEALRSVIERLPQISVFYESDEAYRNAVEALNEYNKTRQQ